MREWSAARIGDVAVCLDATRKPVRAVDRREGPYPYYGASGVIDHVDRYLFDGTFALVAEDGENLRSRNTPVSFLARGKFWVNNHAHILSGTERCDVRFLTYAIENSDISGYLTGSTQPKLTQQSLLSMRFNWPPLAEQCAIAEVLGALDDKIEANRSQIDLLESLISASWEDASSESSEWSQQPISEVAKIVGGSTPRTSVPGYWDGSISWATPKDLSRLTSTPLFRTERSITEQGLQQISSGLLPRGTVLLSSRAPIGYLAIAEVPLAINQGFIALNSLGAVPNLYLWQWVAHHMAEIKDRANGTTFQEISKANFRPIGFDVPPAMVIDRWMNVAEPLYQLVVKLEHETSILATLRDTVLPKLMSGELRVRDAERLVEDAV